jgi:hypothetical protein
MVTHRPVRKYSTKNLILRLSFNFDAALQQRLYLLYYFCFQYVKEPEVKLQITNYKLLLFC